MKLPKENPEELGFAIAGAGVDGFVGTMAWKAICKKKGQ